MTLAHEPAGAPDRSPPSVDTTRSPNELRATLPPLLRRWFAAYGILTVTTTILGLFIVNLLEGSRFGAADRDVARWFADQRTPDRNGFAQLISNLSDSYLVVPAVFVLSVLFVVLFRRWRETLFLLGAILLEKAVFVGTTFIVDRDRPPVGQLDGAPPTSSFPSGHVASAAVVYGVCAIVLNQRARTTVIRVLTASLAFAVTVVVAVSRMLLGMHYLTDVLVGAALGAVCVFLVRGWLDDLEDDTGGVPLRAVAGAQRGARTRT